MDFEDALKILLGWIGHGVEVTVIDSSTAGTIAYLRGDLGPLIDVDEEAASDGETLTFRLEGRLGSWVTLDRPSLVQASETDTGRFGEHVDDHQSELVRGLEEEGRVIAVWNMEDLGASIASAPSRGPEQPSIEGPLHHAVREALGGARGAGLRPPSPYRAQRPRFTRRHERLSR